MYPPASLKRLPKPPLNDDLILEILLRLPAKSISRFRSVSKQFLTLTTSPNFIRSHASRSPTSGFFLFTSKYNRADHVPFDSNSRISDPSLTFLDFDGLSPEFFDCCNGLILCRRPYRSNPYKKQTYCLCVCNPLTRDAHFIPVAERVISSQLFLGFDPKISLHFKVVAVRGGMEGYMFVYSSETRRWRLVTRDLRKDFFDAGFITKSVVWNGAIVWTGFKGSLVLLDLRSEELRRLPFPSSDVMYRYMGTSGGHLHFIGEPQPATHYSITHFDIMEMKPDSSEWSILYRIDLDSMINICPEVNAHVPSYSESQPELRLAIEVVCFLRGEGAVGDRLFLSIPGKIVCYYLQDMSFTTVCNNLPVTRHRVVYPWSFFFPHAHTLVPLNADGNAAVSNQDWVCWPSHVDQLLMDLMVENSLEGQKSGFGFRIGAWRDMVERLNANSQLKYDVGHLKMRLMSYRREYRTVNAMLSYEGFSWDPTLQMVVAGDAEWSECLKRNCNVASYRRRRVPFKALEIICASFPANCHEITPSKIDSDEINAKKGSPAVQEDNGKREEIQDISRAENNNTLHASLSVTLMMFDSCLKELDAMEDIDNELYVKALFIFKEEYNQYVFLKTTGVRRVMWLKAATKDVNLN